MLPADASAGSRPNSGGELEGASGYTLHKLARLLCTPGETVGDLIVPEAVSIVSCTSRERLGNTLAYNVFWEARTISWAQIGRLRLVV